MSEVGRASLDALARTLGVHLVERARHGGPALEMRVDGVPTEVSAGPWDSLLPPPVRIWFDWVPPGELSLIPLDLWAMLRQLSSRPSFKAGSPLWDGRYTIQGCPPEWVGRVLTPSFAKRLEAIRRLRGTLMGRGEVALEAGPSGVSLRHTDDLSRRADALEAFVKESARLFAELRRVEHPGVAVLDASSAAAAGKCPVCAQPVAEPLWTCARCRTPHHEGCREYFGGCAIYACDRA